MNNMNKCKYCKKQIIGTPIRDHEAFCTKRKDFKEVMKGYLSSFAEQIQQQIGKFKTENEV